MENGVWIKKYDSPKLDSPVAVVGSPGLRSVGKLVVESLIEKTNAQLIAELYSTHLPSVYETKPSYAAHPAFPGGSGIIVTSGSKNPELIITKGYHANFDGQYIVAEKVVDFISEMHVKRMIVAAGYGSKEKNVCFAATNQSLLEEMKEKFELCTGYKGPFMGFSGLVFGLSKLRQIESICLFAGTQPNQEDLEYPDKDASELVINKLKQILAF